MTDLEAKISSEFASGDPTAASTVAPLVKPGSGRVSLRHLVPTVAVLLLLGGATITYFAANTNDTTSNESPVVATQTPAEVQSVSTNAPAETTATTPTRAKTTAKAVVKSSPAPAVVPQPTTPAPQPAITPSAPQSNNLGGAMQDLTNSILKSVGNLVTATVSIVL